jgi:hypothetical protein
VLLGEAYDLSALRLFLWHSTIAYVSPKEKPILLTKEWVSVPDCGPVGQPRYPSLPGRRLCVPLFQEVCLFHNSHCRIGTKPKTVRFFCGKKKKDGKIFNLLILSNYCHGGASGFFRLREKTWSILVLTSGWSPR